MEEPERGGTVRWAAVAVLGLAAVAAGVNAWARHAPFDDAFRDLERTAAADPAIHLGRALRDGDLDAFAAAARTSSDPAYAAIWCAEAMRSNRKDAKEAALARWAAVDPENGVVDLIRASFAVERRDIAGAAALVDRGLGAEKPAIHGDFPYRAHVALQQRLGTRDPLALVRSQRRFPPPFPGAIVGALAFARGIAEQAAWDGRFEEAAARARAIRTFCDRLAARSSCASDRLFALQARVTGADLEARLALLRGDVAAARALREEELRLQREDAELVAGATAISGALTGRWLLDALGGPPGLDQPLGEARYTIAAVRLKLRSDMLFRRWRAAEGEAEHVRRLGAARKAQPRRTITRLEVALREPAAFGPAAPGAPPPAELVRWLAEVPRDETGSALPMARWVALPLARYGPRALPALDGFLAQPSPPLAELAALLPVIVRAGHEDARSLVRKGLEKAPRYDEEVGPVAAAAMLEDESFAKLLDDLAAKESYGRATLFAIDRALRAIRGRGIEPPP